MSKQRNIHLFNCDRTYKLDVVEDWLNTARETKLGFDFKVEKHNFLLSSMTELSSKTIPELEIDVAVFVVHAHESRLSINEENAGIGYAKLYRALLMKTDGNVLIVIGGDDNYKDEDEEDSAFISRWARRKISSQFSEEFIDGRKSLICSWNEKHRPIHEAALVHFFDLTKRGEKFEYQPKGKRSQYSATAQSPKADESTWRRRDAEEGKSTPGWNESYAPRLDTVSREDKPMARDPYPGALRGKGMKENRPLHTGKDGSSPRVGESNHSVGMDPLQSNAIWNALPGGNTSLHTGKEGSFRRMCESDHSFGMDPLQSGAFPEPSPRGHASLYDDTSFSFQDLAPAKPLKTEQKDLSIIGWGARPEAVSAIVNLIRRHRDVLSLGTDIDCLNLGLVNDVISYFEDNPLKYCVLVTDDDKIKAVLEQKGGDNLRLLKTAERNIAKGIIITICCSWFRSEQDESIVRSAIKKAFFDSSKVMVTWFENGNLVLNLNELISFLTSSKPFPQQQSACGDCRTHGLTDNQLLKAQFPYPWDYKVYLPSGKTVLVSTHLRNGEISYLQGDVQYWKPGFVVPPEIVNDLFEKNSKIHNAELVILISEGGKIVCQVDKKRGKEWKNSIVLALDETIVLQTRLRHGQISFDAKDLVIHYEKWRVPQDEVNKLWQNYRETPAADLFIASDSKGNSRCIVKGDNFSEIFTFINTVFNQTVGKKVNLI